MKWLKYSFFSILLLLLIILGGITWIVSSEAGLRFLVEQAEQWAPGEFKIETLEGRLLDQVSFTGLSYQYEETALHVDSFLLNWESIALLDMKLHIKQLHVKRVELDLPKSEKTEKKSEPLTLPDIKLPIQIALDDVQIHKVIIRTPDAEPFIIDSIDLRSTTSDIFSLQHLQVQSPLFNAKVAGDVGLISPHRVALALDWSANLPEFTVVGQGKLNGNMQKLILSHTVSQPLAIEIKSTVIDVLGALKIEAVLNWQEIYWPLNTKEHLVNSQQGSATFSGGLENYHFNVETRLTGKDIPAGNWKISAQGNQQALTITKLRTETLKGVLEATGKVSWKPNLVAQLKLNVNEITVKQFWKDWPDHLRLNSELVAEIDKDNFKINRLNIDIPQTGAKVSLKSEGVLAGEKTSFKNTVLNWQGLQWPLVGKSSLVNSQIGSLLAKGTRQNYQVDLETKLAGADIPDSFWSIKGQGNLEAFQLKSLHSTLLKGVMKATGKVSWKPKLVGQLKLNVNKITVKKFWKDWPNQLRINSELVAQIDKDKFKIKRLKINIPQTGAKVSLKSEGVLAGDKTRFKNTVLNWHGLQWPLVGNSSLVKSKKGRAKVSGTIQNYKVDLNTQLVGKDIPYSNWSIKGQGNLEAFRLKSLYSTLLKGAIKANGKVSWKPKLVGQINLNVNKITVKKFWKDWPNHLRLNSKLVAKIDKDKFKIKLLTVDIPQTGAQLSLKGDGKLAGEKTRFNSKLKWKGLQWPLVGKSSLVNSKTGSLQAKGTAQAYQLRLSTDINGKDIPVGHWKAVGQGNSKGFNLKSLQGNILKGYLNLKGQLHWKPALDWKLTLKGKNINLGSQWPEVPSKIALDIRSQGSLKNGNLKTQVQIKRLQGRLRNYPLQLKTTITIDKNQYQIKHLVFKSAKNSLTANGKLGKKSRLDWRINAPNLASLLPELKGSFTGKGRVTGPLNLPHIKGKLEAKSVVFQDNSLKILKADVDVNLFTQKRLRLDIVAKNLSLGTTKVERFSLTGKGSVKRHRLVAKLKLPKDYFSIVLKGGLKQQVSWQGQLEQLNASTAMLGNWKLQAPSALILSATKAKLAQSCVRRTRRSKICTKLHWQKNADSIVQVSLKKLPLNLARAFLDPKTIKSITGQLNGTLKARLNPKGVIKSDALITVSRGFLKSNLDGEQKIIRYKGGTFKLRINQKGLAADWKFGLLRRSSLKGNFKLPGFTQLPLKQGQLMKGQIKAIFDDFSILPTFIPQIEKSQGKLNIDLTLKGSLDNPKVAGLIAVKNAALNLPVTGLELKKFNATIRGSGNDTFKMQARVNSGKGQLKLKGKAKLLSATDWTLLLKIAGKNFEVVNIPVALVLASPDLNLNMAPGKIDVTGKVSIPKAEITLPTTGSGAVAVSKDVVIINPIKPESKPKEKKVSPKLAISSKVKIILGKKVRFEAAGFKTNFGGRVIASNQPGKITLGNGELYIINGSYKAYGQNLKIDRGRVFFAGGPIENPGLDIKAYRKIKRTGADDVIAGIHIQGTAQSPKLTLFSKPPFDQSNILSYIILGKPIANASKGEGNMLLNAVTSLSLKKGDSLTKEIGQTFGLDNAGIDTEDGLENAALVLGKYLTPSLYISYGVGLFDGRNVLRMRYELTKKLTLETETGAESGVDLRYSLER